MRWRRGNEAWRRAPRCGAAAPIAAAVVLAFAGLAFAALAACLSGVASTAHADDSRPQRIVSINLCTDQILLDLVDRDRIRALSHLAADPAVSAAYEAARGIPATRGEAEHVLGFDPDLVLAGSYSTPATVSILERVGRRVVKVPLAGSFEGIGQAVRQIAAAVGETERGESVMAKLDRQLASFAPDRSGSAPSALVYQVNGLASGAGSLAEAVMSAAGFRNHARDLGLGPGGTLALEALVARPPDLLVLAGPADEYRTAVAENLRHPALAAVRRRTASVVLPWRLWLCGTPRVAEAVGLLAAARSQMRQGR